MDPMVAAHLEMAKFKEERMGIDYESVESLLRVITLRLSRLEKLVEALCTCGVGGILTRHEIEVEHAYEVLKKHVQVRRCKAELAELEGK